MLGCGVRLYCNVCLLGSLRCGCFVRRFLVLDFFFVFSILIMCGESWALSLGFLIFLLNKSFVFCAVFLLAYNRL